MFISFTSRHHSQSQSSNTSNENSRFNTPPNEPLTSSPTDDRRNQRSAAPIPKIEKEDSFIRSAKKARIAESDKHLDLITHALDEEGGDSISRELTERLEKLLAPDQDQPLDLITKALEEEGGEALSRSLFHAMPDDLMFCTRTDRSADSRNKEGDSPFRSHRSNRFQPITFLTSMLDQGDSKTGRKNAKRTASGDFKD